MRNAHPILISFVSSSVMLMIGLAGCQQPQRAGELDQALAQLVAGDTRGAETSAQTYIAREPEGPRVAEAYYLKGRALEDQQAPNSSAARANLQAARDAYIAALKSGTADRKLEGLIRASLADVAYWQDDFATAAEQGTAAYGMLEDADAKAWTLYRTGVAQQRLGRFDEADATLRLVGEYHANTEPAQRAAARVGVRGFNVQVATFLNAASADAVVQNLQRQGFTPSKKTTGNKTVVLAGPYRSYGQAVNARARLAGTFPDALIVP
jgi:tetratricopeptide (TPR) repeat protein